MDARETFRRGRSGAMRAGLAAALLTVSAACGSGTAAPGSTAPPSLPIVTTAPASLSSAESAPAPTRTGDVVAPPLTTAESLELPLSVSDPTPSVPDPTTSEVPETSVAAVPTSPAPPAPPSPTTTSTPTPAPVVMGDGNGRVVVIDPGHNGANGAHPSVINAPVDAGFGETKPCNTTGTSTNGGYAEHTFTWAVAGRVTALLQAAGVTVVMTRDSDDGVGPCVNERARIGNEAGADVVVSIHGDGAAAGDRGFYAMTSERLPNGEAVGDASLALAAAVRDGLVDAGAEPSNYVGSEGLWQRDDLAGLNLSQIPTTMLELGNMRDAQDAAFMTSDAGQDALAAGIAQGILDYLAAG